VNPHGRTPVAKQNPFVSRRRTTHSIIIIQYQIALRDRNRSAAANERQDRIAKFDTDDVDLDWPEAIAIAAGATRPYRSPGALIFAPWPNASTPD